MRARWCLLLCVWGCGSPDPEDPKPGDPEDFEPPPETISSTPAPELPTYACSSETAYDAGRDGIVEGTSFSGYDEANPTWLLYNAADFNGNGLLEVVESYERDGSGNVTRYQRERSAASTVTSTYDAGGNLLTTETDAASDGVIDEVETYVRDDEGNILSYSWDYGNDGDSDYSYEYQYGEDGYAVSATLDDDGDGVTDSTYAYVRDENLRMVLLTIDDGNDTVIDYVSSCTYTDPVLAIGSCTTDSDNDTVIDEINSFEYDADNRLLYESTDVGADGSVEYETTNTYDAEGRVLTSSNDGVGSVTGEPYTLDYTYTYDALGRTLQRTIYYAYDGEDPLTNEQYDTTYGGSCP